MINDQNRSVRKLRKPGLFILSGMLFITQSFGQESDFQKAATSIDIDLAAELQKLSDLRAQIAEERPALAKETNEIAAELREKTRLEKLASQDRDTLLHELNALSGRVKAARDEQAYIDAMLDEFRKQFEATISLGEATSIGDINAQVDLPDQAISRLSTPLRVFSGEALGPDGGTLPGKFVETGPLSWFVSEDGKLGGLIAESRGLQPEIVPGTADPDHIHKLTEGKSATPAFDPTLGTVVALRKSKSSLIDHIQQGGFWIWPILLLALIATVAAIAKWIQISRIREIRPAVIQRILDKLQAPDEARAELDGIRHPARSILERGIEVHDQSREAIEEALYEKYLAIQPTLQSGLPFIAIASATAPLLGLLGTVTGMIHTFKLIDIFGTGDAKSLASGISEALVTTEFGLVVAIPALIVHALLKRKVQGIKAAMEMVSLAFLNGLKGGKNA